jgi:hypothetical protein
MAPPAAKTLLALTPTNEHRGLALRDQEDVGDGPHEIGVGDGQRLHRARLDARIRAMGEVERFAEGNAGVERAHVGFRASACCAGCRR